MNAAGHPHRIGGPRRLLCLLLCSGFAAATAGPYGSERSATTPLGRYNAIVGTTHELNKCGQMTPERKEWMEHLRQVAMRPFDWSAAQWAEHNAALKRELEQQFPSISQERCAEVVRIVDHERKTIARTK